MLTYTFTESDTQSLYHHLYTCIRKDILKGQLPPGTKLPSKRTFAKNLNISTITVENAYAQLIAEGYIYSMPKKGYYVSDLKHVIHMPEKPLVSASAAASASHPSSMEESDAPRTDSDSRFTDSYFADFVSNQTAPDNFPFTIWTRLIREVLHDLSHELMVNSPSEGIAPLRTAIAGHLRDFRGMDVSPSQIIVGAGTEYLYGLLLQLLGKDKIYAVENPGYQKAALIYEANGAICHHIDMDQQGVNLSQAVEKGVNVLHISPSHHFPTGLVTPISRRYEILSWASQSPDRYVIEDDYDCEFRLMGQPIPSLQSIDVSQKVIYMNTFSKSLASTIRISYMVLPMPLLKLFQEKLFFYSCTVSTFEQYTLSRFISEKHFEKHINRMRNYYKNKRNVVLNYIKNDPAKEHLTIKEADAGLHFLLTSDTTKSDEEIIENARKQDIRITSLSSYYAEKIPEKDSLNREPSGQQFHYSHTFLINYSNIPMENMEEAIKRLCKLLTS